MACPRSRLAALLLGLAACGPGSDTPDTDAGATAGATGTNDTTDTTAPTGSSGGDDPPANVLACGAMKACGIVLANAEGPGVPPPTAYTAAQTCALQQLAAAAAPLHMHYNDGCEGTCYGALILVRGDGTVIVEPYEGVFEGGVDLDGISAQLASFADSELCYLKDPQYYETCLAAFDAACTSRYNWFEGCAKPAPAACEP